MTNRKIKSLLVISFFAVLLLISGGCDLFFIDLARKNDYESEFFTVTFLPDNGSRNIVTLVEPPEEGEGAILPVWPPEPSLEESLFLGWYMPDGTRFTRRSLVTGDKTLLAQWQEIYPDIPIVEFTSPHGDTPAEPRRNAPRIPGETLRFLPDEPTRVGYIFVGWFFPGTDIEFFPGTQVSLSIELEARWETLTETSVVVSFDGNGARMDAHPLNKDWGRRYGEMPTEPVRDGYIFMGWETKESTVFHPGTTEVIHNITVYAQWSPVVGFSVSFNPLGGSFVPIQMVRRNERAETPSAVSRTGYTFDGWFTDGGFTTPYDFNEIVTQDITLYAKWNPIQYTVKYAANGGNGTIPNTVHTFDVYRTLSTPPAGFSLADHVFDGWVGSNGVPYAPGQNVVNLSHAPGAEVTLSARWLPVPQGRHTVEFNTRGGEYISTQILINNTAASEPANPERIGYTFEGWFLDEALTIQYVFTTPVTEKVVLFARWKPIEYTVNYFANGGTEITASTRHEYDSDAPLAFNNFSLSGHSFNGWNTQPNGSGVTYNEGEIVRNLTTDGSINLYAKWRENPIQRFIVDFFSNGGSFVPFQAIDNGGTVREPLAANIRRTGYTFNAWLVNGSVYNFNFPVRQSFTLHADWNPISYRVIYNSNGGTGTMTPTQHTYDEYMPLSENLFTRDNHTFIGWNSEANGSGTDFYANTQRVINLTAEANADVTLYARWVENDPNRHIVEFNSNGGSMVFFQSVETGGLVTAPPAPEKTGHTFDYWCGDAALTSQWNFNSNSVSGNTVLYAKWNPITYRLVYDANDGSDRKSSIQPHPYDTVVAFAPADTFEREGFVLASWNTEADGRGTTYIPGATLRNLSSTHDELVTLFAQWNTAAPTTYTVNYRGNGATGGSVPDSTHTIGAADNVIRANTFSRTGYTRNEGWWTHPSGGSQLFATNNAGNLTTTSGALVELFTQWTANTYTVNYNLNYTPANGETAPVNTTHTYDDDSIALAGALSRTGYTFVGWNTASSGSGTTYAGGQNVLNLAASGTVNLWARWIETPAETHFVVEFDSMGGPYSTPIYVLRADSEANRTRPLPVPVRPGYRFDGWFFSSDFTGGVHASPMIVNGSTTLYAKWTGNTYRVVYDTDSGSAQGPTTHTYGEPANLAHAPVRSGYTFDGWERIEGTRTYRYAGGQEVENLTTGTGDIHMKALWIEIPINRFIISFNTGGGDFVSPVNVLSGETIIASGGQIPDNPSRGGYTFADWRVGNASGSIATLNTYTTTVDVTLYATWTAISYNVHYHANHNGLNNSTTPAYTDSTYFTSTADFRQIAGNLTAPANHSFAGWRDRDTGIIYHPGLSQTTGGLTVTAGGNVNLDAQWNEIPQDSYVVSFNSNGGSFVATQSRTPSQALGTAPAPTRTGYTFAGWQDDKGDAWASGRVLAGSTTFIAQWTPIEYTIRYHANGGSEAEPVDVPVKYGDNYTIGNIAGLLFAPLTGYNFSGWNTRPSPTTENLGIVYTNGQTVSNLTSIAGDVFDIYAQWTVITHAVQFNSVGGGTVSTQYVQEGDLVSDPGQPTPPVRTNFEYTFDGWTLDENISESSDKFYFDTHDPVTAPFTLHAMWLENAKLFEVEFESTEPQAPLTISSQDVYYQGRAVQPVVEDTDDYLFRGWWTEDGSSGGGWGDRYEFSASVTANLTLYARWEDKPKTPLPQWTSTLVSGAAAQFNAVEVGPDGSIYAVGQITGNDIYNFGNGVTISGTSSSQNPVIVKYSSAGEAVWARSITGGSGSTWFNDLAIVGDNIYVVGIQTGTTAINYGSATATGVSSNHNPVIVKYFDNGVSATHVWARTLSSGASSGVTRFNGVAARQNGTSIDIYAVGSQRPNSSQNYHDDVTIYTSRTSYDSPIIVKYTDSAPDPEDDPTVGTDSIVKTVWGRSIFTSDTAGSGATATNNSYWDAQFHAVTLDNSGNIYVAGRQDGYNDNSNQVWFYYGDNTPGIRGLSDTWNGIVVSYEDLGSNVRTRWANVYDTTIRNTTMFYSIAVSGDHVYAGGSIFNGNNGGTSNNDLEGTAHRPLLARFDATTGSRTASLIPDLGTNNNLKAEHNIRGLAVGSDGSVYAAGAQWAKVVHPFGSTSIAGPSGDSNSVLYKFNASLTLLDHWIMTTPNNGRARLLGVAIDRSGTDDIVYSVGFQNGTGTFDHGNGVSKIGTAGDNAVIVRY